MESNRSGSEVERKFQLGAAFVRDRRWVGVWVLVEPQVSQHGRDGVRIVDFGHNAKFAFALRAGHDIDGEDSTEERCPVEPISFVFLRPALLFGEHVEGAALVRITCGATYRIS